MHTSSIHPGVSQPTAVKARMVCTHGNCCYCQYIAANMRFAGLYFVRIPLVVCVAVVVLLTVMVVYHPEMHRILNWSPRVPDEDHSLAGKRQLEATVGEPLCGDNFERCTEDNCKQDYTEREIAVLAQVLEMRLRDATVKREIIPNITCEVETNVRNPCVHTNCSDSIPESAEDRVRQLLLPQLRLSLHTQDVLRSMAEDVLETKYIFVTAASSDHYGESQALIYNLRHFVFNKLNPTDHAFYYFDIGLSPSERSKVEKNCNCTVKSFPFSSFPPHIKTLKCYGWKPIIIKAMVVKAEVLVYMDTSVRFRNMDFELFFDRVRRRGGQFLHNMDSIPNHTLRTMFHFYGEEECTFTQFPEILAGFSAVHNEPFMNQVVLEPWVACALDRLCMCPVEPVKVLYCPHEKRKWGQCHRFDLSSLTLQMAKLLGEKFAYVVINSTTEPLIERGSSMKLFDD
ncbi:uncharacterized protein LOC112554065 isoform X1 [Pomacea canaliculata]|nr:uncharacterized protein LOC112554065 isoform X1 [Pomacea canaliculata]